MMLRPILVSSCLLGLMTRYDGSDQRSQDVLSFLEAQRLTPIPVCPEQLGGLATPRLKCWLCGGDGHAILDGKARVEDERGTDQSEAFLHGARQILQIAELTGCRAAVLQQRSPSCGTRTVYINGHLMSGMGVTAALLERSGIQLYADDSLPQKTPESG